MQTSTVKQALKVGAQVAQAGIKAERFKDNVTNAVEDAVKATKRAARQGRHEVEDLVDEATYSVKRHPLQAVGLTFGLGFALGAMFGLAVTRLNFPRSCFRNDADHFGRSSRADE